MVRGFRLLIVTVAFSFGAGCQNLSPNGQLGWAVNIGGPVYRAVDGTIFQAEMSVTGGTTGVADAVKATDDGELYGTYREGEIEISHPLASGTYDITFHFTEPKNIGIGDRLFNVFIEGQLQIEQLDVILSRDGNPRSALTVTTGKVLVADGQLNIHLVSAPDQPLLSGLVVTPSVDAGTDDDWELVWRDEFDIDGEPDANNWTSPEWAARIVNSEDQAYTNRTKNLRVQNGNLVIEAHREDYGNARYTSGRLHSSGKADFLYGRVEARARLPEGVGTWAAIWMLPSDPFKYATNCSNDENWQGSVACDAWPNSGEVDIMEHVGYQMGHVHGTVHTRAYYFINKKQRKGRILLDDVAEAFHVYAMEWSPGKIDMFVDDVLYFTYTKTEDDWRSWPFDHPYHLVMNLAIGGDWGRAGGAIDDSIFPQRLVIDYVRVYSSNDK
jgi:beta-glucanase (GH16 family)